MYFPRFMLASLMAASAMAHVARESNGLTRCMAPEATQDDLDRAFQMDVEAAANPSVRAKITVDTVFHVVAAGKTFAQGWLSDQQLSDQLDVMNQLYAPHDIQFKHIKTTRTVNGLWSKDGNPQAMKGALREGAYKTLNIYFQTEVAGGALGLCYFPKNVSPGSSQFIRDGCSILWKTVPGTDLTHYNQGKTVVHEVGHWFNLFHTFQGGCSGAGDHIADTPAQRSPTSGCPTGRDSCKSLPGKDPIHNYMDYSYDPCYEQFTSQQSTRMHNSFNKYRA